MVSDSKSHPKTILVFNHMVEGVVGAELHNSTSFFAALLEY